MISPFLVTPPQPPIPSHFSPLPFASMRVLLHPFTHSRLTPLASPYAGASSLLPLPLMSGKAIPRCICMWSPISFHVYSLVVGFTRWEPSVVQLVNIILPMRLQSSSAPMVLPLVLPLGSRDPKH